MGEPAFLPTRRRPAPSTELIGVSAAMARIRKLVAAVGKSDATVLITGATGTGKENVARALHRASIRGNPDAGDDHDAERASGAPDDCDAPNDCDARNGRAARGRRSARGAQHGAHHGARGARSPGPFVAVNCGAIPEELAEAELFGAEAGAYTGATKARIGHLEAAAGGTLFLDEIGDLPLALQVKLLRALETREIQRLGATRTIETDFRLVAATNVDLERAVREGKFREDLYWRIAVVWVELPPLGQRIEDLPGLVAHFAGLLGHELPITASGLALLAAHDWPGNLRELRNLVDRALALGVRVLDEEGVSLLLRPGRRPFSAWVAEEKTHGAALATRQGAAFGAGHGGAASGGAFDGAADSFLAAPAAAFAPALRRLRQGGAGLSPSAHPAGAGMFEPLALKALLQEAEAALITRALQQSDGTIAASARLLGLKRTTLVEKMRRLGLGPLGAANEAA